MWTREARGRFATQPHALTHLSFTSVPPGAGAERGTHVARALVVVDDLWGRALGWIDRARGVGQLTFSW